MYVVSIEVDDNNLGSSEKERLCALLAVELFSCFKLINVLDEDAAVSIP